MATTSLLLSRRNTIESGHPRRRVHEGPRWSWGADVATNARLFSSQNGRRAACHAESFYRNDGHARRVEPLPVGNKSARHWLDVCPRRVRRVAR